MKFYLCRHAIAVAATPNISDALRPLAPEGVRKFRRAARGLAALDPEIDWILASPLVRAKQTAEILAEELEGRDKTALALKLEPSLAPPGDILALLVRLREMDGKIRGAIAVGHEPILSSWIGQLCFGRTGNCEMKKGAVAAVELDTKTGHGTLLFLLQPAHFRQFQ